MIRSPSSGCSLIHARANQKVNATLTKLRMHAPKTATNIPEKSTICIVSGSDPYWEKYWITPTKTPPKTTIKPKRSFHLHRFWERPVLGEVLDNTDQNASQNDNKTYENDEGSFKRSFHAVQSMPHILDECL